MKEKYQRRVEQPIKVEEERITISWINMLEKETSSGRTNRCTELLMCSGWRSDGTRNREKAE